MLAEPSLCSVPTASLEGETIPTLSATCCVCGNPIFCCSWKSYLPLLASCSSFWVFWQLRSSIFFSLDQWGDQARGSGKYMLVWILSTELQKLLSFLKALPDPSLTLLLFCETPCLRCLSTALGFGSYLGSMFLVWTQVQVNCMSQIARVSSVYTHCLSMIYLSLFTFKKKRKKKKVNEETGSYSYCHLESD